MAVYVGGSRYPDCFGHFQGTFLKISGEPVEGCRKCSPYRKCRDETAKLHRKEHNIKEGEHLCLGDFRGDAACGECAFARKCKARTDRKTAQVEHEKNGREEESLVARLKKKVRDKWGEPEEPEEEIHPAFKEEQCSWCKGTGQRIVDKAALGYDLRRSGDECTHCNGTGMQQPHRCEADL